MEVDMTPAFRSLDEFLNSSLYLAIIIFVILVILNEINERKTKKNG